MFSKSCMQGAMQATCYLQTMIEWELFMEYWLVRVLSQCFILLQTGGQRDSYSDVCWMLPHPDVTIFTLYLIQYLSRNNRQAHQISDRFYVNEKYAELYLKITSFVAKTDGKLKLNFWRKPEQLYDRNWFRQHWTGSDQWFNIVAFKNDISLIQSTKYKGC